MASPHGSNPDRTEQTERDTPQFRTQFDRELLVEVDTTAPFVCRNHNRHQVFAKDGGLITAVAQSGEFPLLSLWKERNQIAIRTLAGQPSAPCLVSGNTVSLWISVDNQVYFTSELHLPLEPVANLTGIVQDAIQFPDGAVQLVILNQDELQLVKIDGEHIRRTEVDEAAGKAVLTCDSGGGLHLAYEKNNGIEYRYYKAGDDTPMESCRPAEAFGFDPALLVDHNRVFLAYLGESCVIPEADEPREPWLRLGQGGYIAVLVLEDGFWRRFRPVDSRQIAKPLWPNDDAFGRGKESKHRIGLETFSPPTLALGPDGAVQVFWSNLERRWIYGARFLGDRFSPAAEVRGPLEQLSGPCLMPGRTPETRTGIPIGMVTQSRVYLDEIQLPTRTVRSGRRIDFVQPDELATVYGLKPVLNQMTRHPENPVIPPGPPGSHDDGGIVADIYRSGEGWRATYVYRSNDLAAGSHHDGLAESPDGIHWTRLDPKPLEQQYQVEGGAGFSRTMRFLEDPEEPDPACRFKGFWHPPNQEVGNWCWVAVVSPDAVHWARVADPTALINADDDLRLWKDPDDIPERRFKASSISRSFCGRVCAQYTSPDGMHWGDERDTLDFSDPFETAPQSDSTGRILLDSWSGPDAEDEVHGGYVFRDGDRWLLHYMPWTCDGHIYLSLAASRDGINFARIDNGAPTVPLGEAGTWDAGRVANREGPFLCGDIWRQYYTGCGWKHGLIVNGSLDLARRSSPNQMGLAEIRKGHWVHLQLEEPADSGTLTTVQLHLENPHTLTVDLEGLQHTGHFVACAVLDPTTGQPLDRFDFATCDPISRGGPNLPVTWQGRGLDALAQQDIRLSVRLIGHRIRLFGLNLVQLSI